MSEFIQTAISSWPLMILAALCLFRKTLNEFFGIVIWRLKSGSSIKISSLEIGQILVRHDSDFHKSLPGIAFEDDINGQRYRERDDYYKKCQNIMLVHRIQTSEDSGQIFDVIIYLITHKTINLNTVNSVRYFFGKYWENKIFSSENRQNGFAIATSAYGPFLCTAEVQFNDGTKVMMHRYIDFESGAALARPVAKETNKSKKSVGDYL